MTIDTKPLTATAAYDAGEGMRVAAVEPHHPLPTSQEVADALSRAYDSTCDVLAMLNEERICPNPGSLEHVAFASIMARIVPQGRELARSLEKYLRHLPPPTEARRYSGISQFDDFDIPF